MLGQRLFSLAGLILPLAGLALVFLAILRVRYTAEVEELMQRDDGRYWKSLPWEARSRYLRRFAFVSWGFTIVILGSLFYGVWAAYWGWYRPGL